MPRCVIFDVDGTLADVTHRRHHVTSKPKNWAASNAGMADDVPNENVVALAKILHGAGCVLIACSGREAVFRDVTLQWLENHGLPVEALYAPGEGLSGRRHDQSRIAR